MRLAAALVLCLAGQAGAGEIIERAEYGAPTTRYAHGVLGDAVEWGSLTLTTSEGRRVTFVLPDERVFEDLEPRLADLDADGSPEVITVEAHRRLGARLAVYGLDGLIAANDYIGRSNRWLAPVGAADLDGDGITEIAYVDRPHLAKTIRIFAYENEGLTEVGRAESYSNHRIGEDFISGGIRRCGSGPELIVAKGDWSGIVALAWTGSGFAETGLSNSTTAAAFADALNCR